MARYAQRSLQSPCRWKTSKLAAGVVQRTSILRSSKRTMVVALVKRRNSLIDLPVLSLAASANRAMPMQMAAMVAREAQDAQVKAI